MRGRVLDSSGRPGSREEVAFRDVEPARRSADAALEGAPPASSTYAVWWKVWLPIPLLLLFVDLGFNAVFWRIPKLSSTSDDYTYQLLHDVRRLQRQPKNGSRVLAFGSSVAGCFDAVQVEDLLAAAPGAPPLEVARLVQPGAKPSDYRLLLRSELAGIDPDVVVALVNLVDFINPSFERTLKPGIRDMLPPWPTLSARFDFIPSNEERLALLAAGVSDVYRYRKPIRSSVRDHAKAGLQWWRGRRAPGYGRYADGYTRARFGVPVRDGAPATLEYFVHPAWIEQRGRIPIRFELDGALLAERVETKAGWQRVALPIAQTANGVVDVAQGSVWSARAAGLADDIRLLGVQLAPALQADDPRDAPPPFRYPPQTPRDPESYLRMGAATGEAYVRRWNELLAEPTDFGHRFRLYRDAKLALRERPFAAVEEFAELGLLLEELTAQGRRVLLVNTPESPLLEGLGASAFYRGYLEYLAGLAAANPRVTFLDLHDVLPVQDMNDWHHVNFVGRIKLGQIFARRLATEIEAPRAGEGA